MPTCGNTALIVTPTHIHNGCASPCGAAGDERGIDDVMVTDVLHRARWETTNLPLTNKRRLQAHFKTRFTHKQELLLRTTKPSPHKRLQRFVLLKVWFVIVCSAGTVKLTSLQAAIWLMYSPSVKMMFCPSECWSTDTQSEHLVILLYSTSVRVSLRKGCSQYRAWWPRPHALESQGWSWWPPCCGCSCPDTTSAPEDTTQTQLLTDNGS